jgi:hypothetical protein
MPEDNFVEGVPFPMRTKVPGASVQAVEVGGWYVRISEPDSQS